LPKPSDLTLVLGAVAFRNEPLQWLANQFLGCVSEDALHRSVRQRNSTGTIDNNNGIWEDVEQVTNGDEDIFH
jgi:hypothetical protein